MAILTDQEKIQVLKYLKQQANATSTPVRWSKAAINDVLQAIEDGMISNTIAGGDVGSTVATFISGKIDTAATVHGLTFTGPEKKLLFALWAELKFRRDK